jgi:hypothetical protein
MVTAVAGVALLVVGLAGCGAENPPAEATTVWTATATAT